MAVLAITNTLFYHAESLADIEALGSDDNITADCIAWIEGLDNFYYPSLISATTTTWAVGIQGIPAGLPNEGLVFFTDAGNQGSFLGGGTVLRDLKGNATGGTLNGVTVTDSHLNFDGTNDNINFTKGTPLDYLFDPTGPGATVMVWCRPETLAISTLLSTRGVGDNDGWSLQLSAGGAIVFTHDFSTVNYSTGSNNNITSVDRWASLTVKGVANSIGLFIDAKSGSQTGFGGTGIAADDTGNSLYLGENEDVTDPFDGDFDVILIWNRVLSNAEVKQAHDALRPRFVAPGMVLIDTLTATSGVTSLTFSDLNGNSDGTYYITGRSFNPPDPAPGSGPLLIEMRPNGLTTNMGSVEGNHKATTSGLVSTTGWILGGWALPEGATDGWVKMDAWIYPEENKGGSTSTTSGRRGYRGVATTLVGVLGTGNILLTDTGGYWNEATTNITSLDIVAAIGTMDTGTSFSLYYIEDAD